MTTVTEATIKSLEGVMKVYIEGAVKGYAEKHGMKGDDIGEFIAGYMKLPKVEKKKVEEKVQCEFVTAKGSRCKASCVKGGEGCSRHTKNPTKKWSEVEKTKETKEEIRELVKEATEAVMTKVTEEVTQEEVKEVTCQYILKKGNKEKGQKKGDKCGEVGCKNKRHKKEVESSASETEGEICEVVTRKGKVCGKTNCKRHASEASEKEVSDTEETTEEEVNGEKVKVEVQEGVKVGYVNGEAKYVYDDETKEWMEVTTEEEE